MGMPDIHSVLLAKIVCRGVSHTPFAKGTQPSKMNSNVIGNVQSYSLDQNQ